MFTSWRGVVGDVKPTYRSGYYAHTKKAFLKHRDVDGIYMLGSGWRLLRTVSILEQDLEVALSSTRVYPGSRTGNVPC